ncbi:MAG TPA: TonB-dependent receptor plug domain-containing protein, partial [Gammaproteobacteria bacterium]
MLNVGVRTAKLAALSLLGLSFACAPAATQSQARDNSVVTAADLDLHPDEPIEYVIQRKVTGVRVSRTQDGNLLLDIRGAMSADGKGDPRPPLYVLNGMTLAPTSDGALPTIIRSDIESIK